MVTASAPLILAYSREPRRWITRARLILAVIATGLIVANLVLVALPPWWTLQREICTECGSARTQTATAFGYRVTARITPTALDAWLVTHEGSHAHAWQFVGETDSTGLRACGRAPASSPVRVFDPHLAAAPYGDIAALAEGLRHPSEQTQEAAVQRFADVVFNR